MEDILEKVWGGSPATEQINEGVKTVDLEHGSDENTTNDNTETTTGNNNTSTHTDAELQEESENISSERNQHSDSEPTDVVQVTTVKRQPLLDGKLCNYRHEKPKRKLPVDTQLIYCAQEELAIKKRLLEQVDKMDQKYAENMEMSQNIERLTNSIADRFMMLQRMMTFQQPAPTYPPHRYSPYSMPGSSSSGISGFLPSPSDPNYQ